MRGTAVTTLTATRFLASLGCVIKLEPHAERYAESDKVGGRCTA
jgi:hypothetical protein